MNNIKCQHEFSEKNKRLKPDIQFLDTFTDQLIRITCPNNQMTHVINEFMNTLVQRQEAKRRTREDLVIPFIPSSKLKHRVKNLTSHIKFYPIPQIIFPFSIHVILSFLKFLRNLKKIFVMIFNICILRQERVNEVGFSEILMKHPNKLLLDYILLNQDKNYKKNQIIAF